MQDPVRGMEVDPQTATQRADYEGKTYYFCAPGCRKAFESDPHKYLLRDWIAQTPEGGLSNSASVRMSGTSRVGWALAGGVAPDPGLPRRRLTHTVSRPSSLAGTWS